MLCILGVPCQFNIFNNIVKKNHPYPAVRDHAFIFAKSVEQDHPAHTRAKSASTYVGKISQHIRERDQPAHTWAKSASTYVGKISQHIRERDQPAHT